jgi:Protein of unknown function (DUF2510)
MAAPNEPARLEAGAATHAPDVSRTPEAPTQVVNFRAAQPPNSAPADWYPDPAGSGRLRYFTGTQWTDHFAAPPSHQPQWPPTAVQTGGPERYFIKLHKHTGLLVLMLRQTYGFSGTLPECERAYRAAQTHNLLAGWWGLLSALVFNWIAIFSNVSAINNLRRYARQPHSQPLAAYPNPAAWYPDPSGAPQQRYWDGRNWTDHLHPGR